MILIVGGAGYIGSHINKYLNEKKYQTVVFDNLSSGHREFCKWGDFVLGDLNDLEVLRATFKKYPIKAVMHFSGFIFVGESVQDPEKYYFNNVVNTLNLLKIMLEFRVKKFIFSSSAAVYGNPLQTPIDESHVKLPINPYGNSKWMIEQVLADYAKSYDLKYVSLRYFNACGADVAAEIGEWHNPETHLIPLVLDVATGFSKNVKVFGDDYETKDGTCIRDYIHVTDLAAAHIDALKYLENGGKSNTFNLGNGTGFSVMEIIQEAEKITGQKISYTISERRTGDPAKLVADAKLAKKVLGWNPQHASLHEIISSAWKWQKKLRKV